MKVPKYEANQVRNDVVQANQEKLTAPAGLFGDTEGATRNVNLATDFFEKAVADADQIATLDADLEIEAIQNRLLNDEKEGALMKRGKNALDAKESTFEKFQVESAKVMGRLTSNAQKAQFSRMLEKRQLEMDKVLEKHVGSERIKFDNETTQASAQARQNSAVINSHDPEIREGKKREIVAILQDHANRNGLPKEWADQQALDALSSTNSQIISRMLQNNEHRQAKEYFAQVKAEFNAKDLAEIEKDLEVGSLKGESMAIADQLVAKYSSVSAAMAELKNITDPDLRDQATQRVREQFQLKKWARDEDEHERYKAVWHQVDKEGTLDNISPRLLRSLDPAHVKDIRNSLSDPDRVAPNGDAYVDLKMQAADPKTRAKFIETSPYTYRAKMRPNEFNELLDTWTQLRNKDTATENKLDSHYTKAQIERDILLSGGVDVNQIQPGSTNAERLKNLRLMINSDVTAKQKQLGRELTNEEFAEVVNANTVIGRTSDGWFFNSEKSAFELDGTEDEFTLDYSQIPKSERIVIEEYLRQKNNGRPVSQEAVIKQYSKYRRDKARARK